MEWNGLGLGLGLDWIFTAPTYVGLLTFDLYSTHLPEIPDLTITITESSLPSVFLYAERRINTHFSVSISVFWRPLNSSLEMPAVPVLPCRLTKLILIVLTPPPPFPWLCAYTCNGVPSFSWDCQWYRRCLTSLIGFMYKVPRGTWYSGLCFLTCCSAFCIYIPCSTSLFHKHTLSWTLGASHVNAVRH